MQMMSKCFLFNYQKTKTVNMFIMINQSSCQIGFFFLNFIKKLQVSKQDCLDHYIGDTEIIGDCTHHFFHHFFIKVTLSRIELCHQFVISQYFTGRCHLQQATAREKAYQIIMLKILGPTIKNSLCSRQPGSVLAHEKEVTLNTE